MLFIASLRIGSHRKACKGTAFFANTQIFLLFFGVFFGNSRKKQYFCPDFLERPCSSMDRIRVS